RIQSPDTPTTVPRRDGSAGLCLPLPLPPRGPRAPFRVSRLLRSNSFRMSPKERSGVSSLCFSESFSMLINILTQVGSRPEGLSRRYITTTGGTIWMCLRFWLCFADGFKSSVVAFDFVNRCADSFRNTREQTGPSKIGDSVVRHLLEGLLGAHIWRGVVLR